MSKLSRRGKLKFIFGHSKTGIHIRNSNRVVKWEVGYVNLDFRISFSSILSVEFHSTTVFLFGYL